MSPKLTEFITRYRTRNTEQLATILNTSSLDNTRLNDAMHYSVLNGGKRIRPILVYAAARCIGEINNVTDTFACAIECIHAYSLIHDDLPAMDNDDLRRGMPTCHIEFDEATAILAGDALQCLAFELISYEKHIPAQTAIKAMQVLTHSSGRKGMVLGQAIDLAAVNRELPLESLEAMHKKKTGELIKASIELGALSAGASESEITQLRDYASAIGLAFQVQDDIIDVISDTATLGKHQGSDADSNKPTYVSLLGIKGAQKKARELHHHAVAALESFGENANILRDLASYIVKRET